MPCVSCQANKKLIGSIISIKYGTWLTLITVNFKSFDPKMSNSLWTKESLLLMKMKFAEESHQPRFHIVTVYIKSVLCVLQMVSIAFVQCYQ